MEMLKVADLVNLSDHKRRTWREINNSMKHAIPIGSLVELENGSRLFVVKYTRDCDGTPLYCLHYNPEELVYDGASRFKIVNGYSEEALKVCDAI